MLDLGGLLDYGPSLIDTKLAIKSSIKRRGHEPVSVGIQDPQVTKESKSGMPEQPKRINNECSTVGDSPCKSAFCTNLKLHNAIAGGSNQTKIKGGGNESG